MFTNSIISSKDLESKLKFKVIKHFDFSFCGKIGLQLPRMLIYVDSSKYVREVSKQTNIVGVVCPPELVSLIPTGMGVVVSSTPKATLNSVQSFIASREGFQWKNFKTKISKSAQIHKSAFIAEENVIIGDNVQIGPNSVVLSRSLIDDECRIGSNCTIGCESFEPYSVDGALMRFEQSGGVKIGKRVTIFSNVCIVKATYGGFTQVGENSMIDNLTHIAHDVDIGTNVKVIACAEISGRVKIGNNSTIGMNATILNGIKIGESCDISLGSVVTRDVLDQQKVTGNFAIPHEQFIKKLKKE